MENKAGFYGLPTSATPQRSILKLSGPLAFEVSVNAPSYLRDGCVL